jgi:hypothetical protein
MFFPDKRLAYAEARRVLTEGGAILVNTWGTLESHDFQAAIVAALAVALPDDPPTFLGSVPHGYADPGVAADDFRAAGFDHVTVETVTLEGRAVSARDIADGYCNGTPLRPEIEARGDLETTISDVTAQLERTFGSGPVSGRMTAHVIEASR